MGEVCGNYIYGNGVQVGKENEKFTVVWSRSPKSLEFGHFTRSFCWQRNVQKHKRTCTVIVFVSEIYCFVAFSLPFPSSLLKLLFYEGGGGGGLGAAVHKCFQLVSRDTWKRSSKIMSSLLVSQNGCISSCCCHQTGC